MTLLASTGPVLAAAADTVKRSSSNTLLKLHPFLALIGGSAVLGIVARYPLADTLELRCWGSSPPPPASASWSHWAR